MILKRLQCGKMKCVLNISKMLFAGAVVTLLLFITTGFNRSQFTNRSHWANPVSSELGKFIANFQLFFSSFFFSFFPLFFISVITFLPCSRSLTPYQISLRKKILNVKVRSFWLHDQTPARQLLLG